MNAPTNPNAAYIEAVRGRLGWTQGELAKKLGLSLRAYQDIEAGRTNVKFAYVLAVDHLAMFEATARGNPMLAGDRERAWALDFVGLIRGE